MFKYVKILYLLVFLSSLAYAQQDQVLLDGGIGIAHSADTGLSETKMLTLGIQEDLWGAFKDRAIVGGYLDNSGNGKRNSALAAAQIGFEVNRNGLIVGVFTGPGVISSPDALLGGYFQFVDDIHIGIQDTDDNYFGVMYRHISSAGIETPNIGRDVIGLEMRF
jgi:hypothetical protein